MLLLEGKNMASGDDESKELIEKWKDLSASLMEQGVFEAGNLFAGRGKVIEGDTVSVLKIANGDINGYIVIKTPSIDVAASIAKKLTIEGLSSSVIVRPCVEVA